MADIELEIMDRHEESSVWQGFLDRAEASVFQRPSFLAYHPEGKFPAEQVQVHHMGVLRKGKQTFWAYSSVPLWILVTCGVPVAEYSMPQFV